MLDFDLTRLICLSVLACPPAHHRFVQAFLAPVAKIQRSLQSRPFFR